MRFSRLRPGWLLLAAMLSLALFLRIWHLATCPGINGDEAWYGVQAAALLKWQPFAWRTPTGLLLNPFHMVLLVPIQAITGPRFMTLRLPALISGVAAVALAYVLLRGALDRVTAGLAAGLLAVLPTAIAYSRLGWDASQVPLFSVVALSFALRGKTVATALALGAAMVVHPTCAFLIPALAGAWIGARWQTLGVTRRRRAAVLLAGLAWLVMLAAMTWYTTRFSSDDLRRRLAPDQIGEFIAFVGRLFSGITVYEYIVGPIRRELVGLHDLVFWVVALVLLDLGLRRLAARGQAARFALVCGVGVSIVTFYLVAGVPQLGLERYAMFLIVPGCVAIACLARSLLPEANDPRFAGAAGLALATLSTLGGAWLVLFAWIFFSPLLSTGGEAHRTFRTARIEPKQFAFDAIMSELDSHGGRSGIRIIAEDWWLDQPIRYLASAQPGVRVTGAQTWMAKGVPVRDQRQFLRRVLDEGGYVLCFAGSEFDQLLLSCSPTGTIRVSEINDLGGRPLLNVYRDLDAVSRRFARIALK